MFNLNNNFVAVTNRHLCTIDFLTKIEELCKTNVRLIILREKDLTCDEYKTLAEKVLQITKKFNKPLYLHNFIECCDELKVKNIHLPFEKFKELCKTDIFKDFDEIGTSVHSLEDAVFAEQNGATYITAGHIYETDCKKGLQGRGINFLKEICSTVKIPVFAIGGIDDSNINEVLKAGADAGCVMSGCMK